MTNINENEKTLNPEAADFVPETSFMMATPMSSQAWMSYGFNQTAFMQAPQNQDQTQQMQQQHPQQTSFDFTNNNNQTNNMSVAAAVMQTNMGVANIPQITHFGGQQNPNFAAFQNMQNMQQFPQFQNMQQFNPNAQQFANMQQMQGMQQMNPAMQQRQQMVYNSWTQ